MKTIIKLMALLWCFQIQAQEKVFYQSITQKVNYIKTNENTSTLFFYIDTTFKEDYIKVSNIENTQQVAKIVNDTLILLNEVCKNKKQCPIININLRYLPQEIDVGKNSNVVFSVLKNISTERFFINVDKNSALSFCAIYDCAFDSLIVNQQNKSDIYFSNLKINKFFYLKTDNAIFQANETHIKNDIVQTILSNKSNIKLKGFKVKQKGD